MLRVEEARELILQHAPARRVERRSLEEALGFVLAKDVVAPEPLPAFPRSGMDGYALASGDTHGASRENPVTLLLSGVVPAGHPMTHSLSTGEAASIMTGGAIPAGADAVIRKEEVRVGPEGVCIFREVPPGENLAPVGEDVSEGQVVLTAGHLIRSAEIHLLAAMGIELLPVYAPPRVGILCTGDELVSPGVTPAYGQIRNSNGPGISAMVRSAKAIPVYLGQARDTTEVIAQALRGALDCDLILTTGGVSVGDFDVVRETMAALGARELFWRVSLKPGMPVCAGLLEGKLIIGLSGNPAAAITNFDLMVRPLLDQILGRKRIGLRETEGFLDQPVLKSIPLTRYLRAFVYFNAEGELRINTEMAQRTGVLSSMVRANAYALIPGHSGTMSAGTRVRVLLYDDTELL